MYSINILKQDRTLIYGAVKKLSPEAYLLIPPGFDNNIIWNVGHIVVVQQLLHYKLCNLETYVSEEQIAMFRTGTSPADWSYEPDMAELLELLNELPTKFEADYGANKFQAFQGYTTRTGINLKTIEDAIAFNNFHEGLHLGAILALRNLVLG